MANLRTIDRCVYCGTDKGPLRDEHTVPVALKGIWKARDTRGVVLLPTTVLRNFVLITCSMTYVSPPG